MIKLHNKTVAIPIILLGILLLVVFSVIKINLDEQAVFLCDAISNDPNLEMSQCPAHQQSNSWYLFIGFGAAFVMLIAGVFMLFFDFSKGNSSSTKTKEIDMGKLDEQEKEVVIYIKNNESSVYQSDLVKQFGWTKVRTTRILDKLEHKNILERKRRGMTNLVVLR